MAKARVQVKKKPDIQAKKPEVQPKKPEVQPKKPEVQPEKSIFGFTVSDFEQIPSIPIYKCTESEFKDPIKLIRELRRLGYDEYGCVKLVPPKSFKPPFCFSGKGRPITTRKQVLQDLSKAEVEYVYEII